MEALKKMDPDSKADWYRTENDKRKAEDKLAKRTFDMPQGYIVQQHETSSIKDEVDEYEVFDDFALRMIGLRKCNSHLEAGPLWSAALQAPGAVVIERRGVKCLGRFKGISCLKREADASLTGSDQQMSLDSSDQLSEFLNAANATHDRTQRKAAHSPLPRIASVVLSMLPLRSHRLERQLTRWTATACVHPVQILRCLLPCGVWRAPWSGPCRHAHAILSIMRAQRAAPSLRRCVLDRVAERWA